MVQLCYKLQYQRTKTVNDCLGHRWTGFKYNLENVRFTFFFFFFMFWCFRFLDEINPKYSVRTYFFSEHAISFISSVLKKKTAM